MGTPKVAPSLLFILAALIAGSVTAEEAKKDKPKPGIVKEAEGKVKGLLTYVQEYLSPHPKRVILGHGVSVRIDGETHHIACTIPPARAPVKK